MRLASQSRRFAVDLDSMITPYSNVSPAGVAKGRLDPVVYDELTDIILCLQRNNDALNASLQMARWMTSDEELQRALHDLRNAERRITYFTAEVVARVRSGWYE